MYGSNLYESDVTSSQCNWKGNQKGKGTDETPLYEVESLVDSKKGRILKNPEKFTLLRITIL